MTYLPCSGNRTLNLAKSQLKSCGKESNQRSGMLLLPKRITPWRRTRVSIQLNEATDESRPPPLRAAAFRAGTPAAAPTYVAFATMRGLSKGTEATSELHVYLDALVVVTESEDTIAR